MSEPLYSIGRTSELSGVPVETVRIWERRYGIVRPTRTEGGHRKYSARDIELLSALKVLVDGGARIGNLCRLSRGEIIAAAFPTSIGEAHDDIARGVLDAARAYDEVRLRELLRRPLASAHIIEVARELYLPLLANVGELWHEGKISVAAEHLVEKEITGIVSSALQDLHTSDGPRVVAACVEGDRHEVGLLVAALMMRARGMSVIYLGADLPVEDLAGVIERTNPRLVVLSSTQAPTDDIVRRLDRVFMRQRDASRLWVGGRSAHNLVSRMSSRVRAFENLGNFVTQLDKISEIPDPEQQPTIN